MNAVDTEVDTAASSTREGGLGVLMLWASLFFIAALAIVQIGGGRSIFGPAGEARADLVSSADDFTTLTFNANTEDVLVVMDGRGENLFVYRIRNQSTVEFLDRLELADIFNTSRRMGAGREK